MPVGGPTGLLRGQVSSTARDKKAAEKTLGECLLCGLLNSAVGRLGADGLGWGGRSRRDVGAPSKDSVARGC